MQQQQQQQQQQVAQRQNNNTSVATPTFWNHYIRDFFDDPFFREPFSFNWPRVMMPTGMSESFKSIANVRSDISETEKEVKVVCEVPGLKKQDLKIEVDDDTHMLTISGEQKTEQKEENEKYHVMERGYGSFTRRFRLPDNANTQEIKAKLEDGVLRLNIPKVEQAQKKVKQIELE